MKLIDHIRPGPRARFQYYRSGELWYLTDTGLLFPVPITDTGDARFEADDKASAFMKWIRKWLIHMEENHT